MIKRIRLPTLVEQIESSPHNAEILALAKAAYVVERSNTGMYRVMPTKFWSRLIASVTCIPYPERSTAEFEYTYKVKDKYYQLLRKGSGKWQEVE